MSMKKQKKLDNLDKEITLSQVKSFWASSPELEDAEVRGTLIRRAVKERLKSPYKKGPEVDSVITEEMVKQFDSIVPQNTISSEPFFQMFAKK